MVSCHRGDFAVLKVSRMIKSWILSHWRATDREMRKRGREMRCNEAAGNSELAMGSTVVKTNASLLSEAWEGAWAYN